MHYIYYNIFTLPALDVFHLTAFSACHCMQSQSYTNYFADALVAEAKKDARIVGIHAAMGGGTGMNRFEKASTECLHATALS